VRQVIQQVETSGVKSRSSGYYRLQVLCVRVRECLLEFRLDPDEPTKGHAGNIIAVDSLPIR